jgi:hypothetical protein
VYPPPLIYEHYFVEICSGGTGQVACLTMPEFESPAIPNIWWTIQKLPVCWH